MIYYQIFLVNSVSESNLTMKKLILYLFLASFSNVIFASFPVNNISNQNEMVLESKPVGNIIGTIVFVSLIIAYPFSIIRYLSKPIPKDVAKKKKFFKKLIFLILIPPILVLSIYAIVFYTTFSF